MNPPAVTPWMILPFWALLAAIAVMPLWARPWWERHYPKVALGLGAGVLLYYFAGIREWDRPLETAHEYVSFICMIGSLFVVSGGIHIRVKGEATPRVNVLILAIGGVLANLIGTTGASMLLVRPFLRANKYRLTAFHVVFFIFVVSNVGGSLTPIGDPPLYLGYLKGIPFLWTMIVLFPKWLFGMGWLLGVFYILDSRNFRRAPPEIRQKETAHETWVFEGLHNLGWLAVILAALFLRRPLFLREAVMVAVAALSWRTTRRQIHEANHFSWAPIREVAILFAGIFATMIPALDWLEHNSRQIGIQTAGQFFWSAGSLSAVLDNAPTYLNFLSASIGLFVDPHFVETVRHLAASGGAMALAGPDAAHAGEVVRTVQALRFYHPEALRLGQVPLNDIQICYLLGNHARHIAAISIGAVFFGACTYIGNGPNFMVRSIAEEWGAKMPGFMGYIVKFTLPFLLPMLFAVWLIFFRAG